MREFGIFDLVVSVGKTLPIPTREFYFSWVRHSLRMSEISDDAIRNIAVELGIDKLSDLAELWDSWGDATERDDHEACQRIEQQIDAAGMRSHARDSIQAVERLNTLLRAFRSGNGRLH